MTIATTTGRELTIDSIVTSAYRLAALLSPYQAVDQQKAGAARSLLDVITKRLEADGIPARSASFTTITLANGVFQYTMPAVVLDVFGSAMWIDPTQASDPLNANELVVNPKLRDEYQRLTSKDATGRPLFYYTHRETSPPQVWLWPHPGASEAGGLIRFQTHRLRSDAVDGGTTLDYEIYWEEFFVWELAHQLSLSNAMPLDRVGYLAQGAEMKRVAAKKYSMQRPGFQFSLEHRSGQGRRSR